mmetsp:Transcript_7289/g.15702  ORF Transcript_7289/g.15702 Transcript_7289/m.15702 type:complete len:104 (+) Transcript_7289:257-568(+)
MIDIKVEKIVQLGYNATSAHVICHDITKTLIRKILSMPSFFLEIAFPFLTLVDFPLLELSFQFDVCLPQLNFFVECGPSFCYFEEHVHDPPHFSGAVSGFYCQ